MEKEKWYIKLGKIALLYLIFVILSNIAYYWNINNNSENQKLVQTFIFALTVSGPFCCLTIKNIFTALFSEKVLLTTLNRFFIFLVSFVKPVENTTKPSKVDQKIQATKNARIDRYAIFTGNLLFLAVLVFLTFVVSFEENMPSWLNSAFLITIIATAILYFGGAILLSIMKSEKEESKERN